MTRSPVGKPDATRKQIRGSALILVGRGLAVGINFLTQVLVVRFLVKEDYGAFAYALAVASFLGQSSQLGMDKAILRFGAVQEEREEYARMFGTLLFGLTLVAVIGLACIVVVHSLSGLLGASIISDPLSLQLLLIVIVLAPVSALNTVMESVFAVFSKPRLIFFRKHIVAPALKFTAVLFVIVADGGARSLAIAHVVTGILGLAIGLSLAVQVLRERDLLSRIKHGVELRVRELLAYGLPMVGSDVTIRLRGMLPVLFLESLRGTVAVADFRAVLPVARLNRVVLDSFAFMFVPQVARLAESPRSSSLNEVYWRSSAWVAALSLPVFLVTFCLARPLAVLLFGGVYATAGPVLALLAAGVFVNATMEMSGLTLKAIGRVREVMSVDLGALLVDVPLTLVLVQRYGAVGAAAAFAFTAVAHALAYHLVLVRVTAVRLIPRGYGILYAGIVAAIAVVFTVAVVLSPPIWLGVPLAAVAWVTVIAFGAMRLEVDRTFPELMRVPVVGTIIKHALRVPTPTPRTHDPLVARVTGALERALPPSGRTAVQDVRLVRAYRGNAARLLEFDVNRPEGQVSLLVKAAVGYEGGTTAHDRWDNGIPRIGVAIGPDRMIEYERLAMKAIDGHLGALRDARFGTVRIHDSVDIQGAIVMERLPHPTLRSIFLRPGLGGSARSRLRRAANNSGAWLRAFHAMPALDHAAPRLPCRSDFLDSVGDFAAFLRERGASKTRLDDAVARARAWAPRVLPERLPCAMGHGDFAPRNILVDDDERVHIIDAAARWWCPVYLDVACFLTSLRTVMPLVLTGGLHPSRRLMEDMERAFLDGYFAGQPFQRETVALFELQSLLARWASMVGGTGVRGRLRLALKGLRAAHMERCVRETLRSLGSV